MRILISLAFVFCITSAFAEEIPTLRYKITMSPDGEPVVEKIDEATDQNSGLMSDPAALEKATELGSKKLFATPQVNNGFQNYDGTSGSAWVVTDSNGTFVAAGPAGDQKIIEAMKTGQGLKMQTVGWSQFLFGGGSSLDDMEESIKLQMRRAAAAFQSEACQTMRNWKEVKFSFELGADALVVAKINGEGTFVPADVCP